MKIDEDLAGLTKKAWHLFIDRTEPLRPELYRYCRSLTGSVWDAEDLVQDTLMRAFARLSEASHPIANARAYLFRIASNLWIDKFRGTREFTSVESVDAVQPEAPDAREIRDAAVRLVSSLPPMERAAVLLKDVFDFTLEEAATALETTAGGVKAALHRGRSRLKEVAKDSMTKGTKAVPSSALVDRFVIAFNQHDVKGLTALMREDATSEMVGMGIEYGREAIGSRTPKSTLFVSFELSADSWRVERRDYLDESIIVSWLKDGEREVVNDIVRLEELETAVSRIRYYYFCPEVLAEVCGELGIPVTTSGYTFPLE